MFRRSLPLGVVRALLVLAGAVALVLALAFVLAGSYVYRIGRVAYLSRRNRQLEAEFAKLGSLRRGLARLEEQNRRMAEMLGVGQNPPPVDWRMGSGEWQMGSGDSGTGARVPTDSAACWGSQPVPRVLPLQNYVVSRRFSPSHTGIDLAAQSGTPVRAAADGVVTSRGTDSVFGRFTVLSHFQGYESYYGHLEAWRVALGDTVLAGGILGTVGSSGRSSAPHLHFEIRRDQRPFDPARVLEF